MSGGDFIDRTSCGQQFALQRDKDIPPLVDRLGGIGLIGSDAWLLQDSWLRGRLECSSLFVLDGVRFALSALQAKAGAVRKKVKQNQPLAVAATYPGLAKRTFGPQTKVVVSGGGLEALPSLMPELDGTFDLVETGRTAKENNLVIVADNLVPVTLDLIWPKSKPNLLQSIVKE